MMVPFTGTRHLRCVRKIELMTDMLGQRFPTWVWRPKSVLMPALWAMRLDDRVSEIMTKYLLSLPT